MTVPFMRAYTELLVKTCHRRGAHAMGGMAAFIPSRRDAEVNERALAKVREDKEREAGDGFDGTWVAHPDLVPVALRGVRPRARRAAEPGRAAARGRRRRARPTSSTSRVPGGEITEAGLADNVSVGIHYLESWLRGDRRRGDLQPDGGRGDRRDLALPGLAVAAPRAHRARRGVPSTRRGRGRSREASATGCCDRRRAAELVRARRARRGVRGVPDPAGLRLPGATSTKGTADADGSARARLGERALGRDRAALHGRGRRAAARLGPGRAHARPARRGAAVDAAPRARSTSPRSAR